MQTTIAKQPVPAQPQLQVARPSTRGTKTRNVTLHQHEDSGACSPFRFLHALSLFQSDASEALLDQLEFSLTTSSIEVSFLLMQNNAVRIRLDMLWARFLHMTKDTSHSIRLLDNPSGRHAVLLIATTLIRKIWCCTWYYNSRSSKDSHCECKGFSVAAVTQAHSEVTLLVPAQWPLWTGTHSLYYSLKSYVAMHRTIAQ